MLVVFLKGLSSNKPRMKSLVEVLTLVWFGFCTMPTFYQPANHQVDPWMSPQGQTKLVLGLPNKFVSLSQDMLFLSTN